MTHCFDDDGVEAAARQRGVEVIVAHGVDRDLAEFRVFWEHVEVCPIFVSTEREIRDLRHEQIVSVFEGAAMTWEALGSRGGRIGLLLHGGELQRRSLARLLELMGSAESFAGGRARYLSDYEALAHEADTTSECLVIGLRRLHLPGYQVLAIDGAEVYDWRAYPLRMAVRVLVRPTPSAGRLGSEFVAATRQRVVGCWEAS